ncbi:MAG: hypothetical protein ACTSQE_15730 [Candidatus Heimdallarchaeaceae archaeon]
MNTENIDKEKYLDGDCVVFAYIVTEELKRKGLDSVYQIICDGAGMFLHAAVKVEFKGDDLFIDVNGIFSDEDDLIDELNDYFENDDEGRPAESMLDVEFVFLKKVTYLRDENLEDKQAKKYVKKLLQGIR